MVKQKQDKINRIILIAIGVVITTVLITFSYCISFIILNIDKVIKEQSELLPIMIFIFILMFFRVIYGLFEILKIAKKNELKEEKING